jgi:uncharacterized RDD family membrane protein YckC
LKQKPGFWRYLAIILYDALLLVSVLFFATLLILPFNAGIAFDKEQFLYPAYLFSVSFLFYGWFWTHGGQTLGLQVWKSRVLNRRMKALNWTEALIRFMVAILSWSCLGLGVFWILIDRNRRTWHDMISNTEIYLDLKK